MHSAIMKMEQYTWTNSINNFVNLVFIEEIHIRVSFSCADPSSCQI